MFRVARAVLLSMRASEDFVGAEKLSVAEQIKPDCCRTPAVVSILTDSAARVIVLLCSTTPLQLYHRFIDINYNRYSAFKTFLITVHWKQSVSCNAFAGACIDDRETCSC